MLYDSIVILVRVRNVVGIGIASYAYRFLMRNPDVRQRRK